MKKSVQSWCTCTVYMAVEFRDQPMTADEMKAAFDSAHATDYDAMMTAKVFEAMLRFAEFYGD